MWTFLLLYFLGNAFCQVDENDNSTQMYYFKLKIEQGAISSLKDILKPLDIDSDLTVNSFQNTTTCQETSDDSFLCECALGHKWSEEVCKSHPDCCETQKCSFLKQSDYSCIPKNTVSVNGSIHLKGLDYLDCLDDEDSEEFQSCNDKLLEEMKAVYSTIKGFDSLKITHYSVGRIEAYFELIYAMDFVPQELNDRSRRLCSKLKCSSYLNTTGFVQLKMPQNPVHYHSQHKLICSVKYDMGTLGTWGLKRGGEEFNITTGTESVVTAEALGTNIALKNISVLWAGEYSCEFLQSSDLYVIIHKASGVLDVCLKPNIYISLNPSFPYCKDRSDVVKVEAECEIGNSTEDYSVTWSGEGITGIKPGYSKDGVFRASTLVNCNSTKAQPQMICTFMNRCNQSTSDSIQIEMIHDSDTFCEEEDEWQNTKAGFTARLRCQGKHGIRQRKCSSDAEWQSVNEECVNPDLIDVANAASVVDIGLGFKDKNAALVLSKLEKITNNTETIDTSSNLKASVSVIETLSQKLIKEQDNSVDDFLGTSSNLLEKSLKDSWLAEESNTSLAETYLISVEQIIHMTNIKQNYEKKNVELASRKCLKGHCCINKVYNTSVNLKAANPGSVVTVGFKELQEYLPNNRDDYEPGSFVISTTTEKDVADSVEVEINFALLRPRPPNVPMICVAWDNVTKAWSNYGCEWRGPESVCSCKHLSSFSILMGKRPLKVRFLTEITNVGLSVSVVSLIISLLIELIVWSAVVKTSTSYLRHTAHVNICLCLLVADCCFLASSKPESLSSVWCKTLVILKHFCYLAKFFWMLWLSSTLLHQTVFLFHNVSKKSYLRLSVLMGYVCPLLIVTTTFLANRAGAEGQYYSKETCWLIYKAPLKGSAHTFILPIGIIAFFNMFAMLVVIMKLLDHPKTKSPACEKEKKAVITVVRTVVLLTPIFGLTWIFGFAVLLLDLTYGLVADLVNYAFVLLNAFQGLFILLTLCLGDTMTREELLKRLKIKAPVPHSDPYTDSTTNK